MVGRIVMVLHLGVHCWGGMIHNNANQFIQNLSNGLMPTMIVGAAVANVTIFICYFSGKIDKAELCKQLGRTNTSLLSGGAMCLLVKRSSLFLWLERSLGALWA